jgi:hypothetical protein
MDTMDQRVDLSVELPAPKDGRPFHVDYLFYDVGVAITEAKRLALKGARKRIGVRRHNLLEFAERSDDGRRRADAGSDDDSRARISADRLVVTESFPMCASTSAQSSSSKAQLFLQRETPSPADFQQYTSGLGYPIWRQESG